MSSPAQKGTLSMGLLVVLDWTAKTSTQTLCGETRSFGKTKNAKGWRADEGGRCERIGGVRFLETQKERCEGRR